MLFSSVIFLFFFLPFTLGLYSIAGRWGRNAVLLLASLVFYGWSEGRAMGVLLLSIAVNYGLGRILDRGSPRGSSRNRVIPRNAPEETAPADRTRSAALLAGLVFNLALLAYFKYTGFFVSILSSLLPWLGMAPLDASHGSVPTGISFFTFAAISYLVDIHKGRADAERNPARFAIFMAAFPKILAGPIVAYHDGKDELTHRRISLEGFASGIERFILGLGKKVLIAGPISSVADQVFDLSAESLTTELAWLGILCYTLQIYFDFSGYTDMAIGAGRMFGFHFPENFNFPYAARSIQDFWRRWHMSLSRWLRDYLYIPLGGNRCAPGRQYLNLVTVFVLCGLWHGANWTFVVWGLWYGVFLILEKTRFGRTLQAAPRPVQHIYAVLVVGLGWVFFRSESLAQAFTYFVAMGGIGPGVDSPVSPRTLIDSEVLLALLLGMAFSVPLADSLKRALTRLLAPPGTAWAGATAVLYGLVLGSVFSLACMALAGGTLKSFIYFRF
ncbi:MAG: MBOAT family protein [Syntrophobacteraceae bacterium]